jgi:hypothetical protein
LLDGLFFRRPDGDCGLPPGVVGVVDGVVGVVGVVRAGSLSITPGTRISDNGVPGGTSTVTEIN